MAKKLIIVLLGALILSVSSYAQDYESRGDAAIKRGDYKTAVESYEAQMSYMKYNRIDPNSKEYLLLEKKCSKAQECRTLKSKAAGIVKKLDVDFYSVLSSKSKSQGDEQIVSWNANIKQLTNTYNNILQRFPNDGSTKSMLSAVSKYKPLIDQAYFDAYTMPEKWAAVQAVGTSEAYQAFLDEYPDSRFADMAYQAVHKQEDDTKWALAQKGNDKESYNTYLQTMPRGAHISEAIDIITKIEADESYWAAAVEANSVEGYSTYLKNTKNGFNKLAASANMKLLTAKQFYDRGNMPYCKSDLASFRALSDDPVSLLLAENKDVYSVISEVSDYDAWVSNKSYTNAKQYVEMHPHGTHYPEVSDFYAKLLADSWDYLAPGVTASQVSYISSFAQGQNTIDYVHSKVREANKIGLKIQSNGVRYAEYSGNSTFYGYKKEAATKKVRITLYKKPKDMPQAEIWVDGKMVGNDNASLYLAPGYHTVSLRGWAYTNKAKYSKNKSKPSHVKQYVIQVSNDGGTNEFYFKCPGAASYGTKNALKVTAYTVSVVAAVAAGIASGIVSKK